MRWDEITIIVGDRRLQGDAARRHVAHHYGACVNGKVKKLVALNRQQCAAYFSTGGGQAKGSAIITDAPTIGWVLRAWFGANVELPPPAQPPAPQPARVQRAGPNVVRKPPPQLAMYMDADRDGAIDPDPPNRDRWTWGADGYGAILMAATHPWAEDEVVAERAPLEFDWQQSGAGGWSATLAADFPDRICIYRGNRQRDELLLGPGRSGPLDLAADPVIGAELRAGRRVRLWMDAPDFPLSEAEANWLVMLTLTFTHAGRHSVQPAVLRIAPWIMSGDLDPTAMVYLRDIVDSDLVLPVTESRERETQLRANYVRALVDRLLQLSTTPCERRMLRMNANEKGFMRDVMKFGYTATPSANRLVCLYELEAESSLMDVPGALQGASGGQLSCIQRPAGLARDARLGQDNGGNYLVTPKRPGYEYGRIIYGDTQGGGWCHAGPFLQAQRLQSPIVLDSTWLDVGHVDEFLSFVPDYSSTAHPDKPFKVLIASPRLAYLMLRATANQLGYNDGADLSLAIAYATQANRDYYNRPFLSDDLHFRQDTRFSGKIVSAGPDIPASVRYSTVLTPTPPAPTGANGKIVTLCLLSHSSRVFERLWGPQAPQMRRVPLSDGTNTVAGRAARQSGILEIHRDITAQLSATDDEWQRALTVIQPQLNAIRQTLKAELELDDDDFIEVPVMLRFSPDQRAYFDSPDCVNLLALNDSAKRTCTCLVPKPLGPVLEDQYVFETYLSQQLGQLGLQVHFINDLPFSQNHGEIHCGTNQRPPPLGRPQWWLYQPPSIP